MSYLIRFVKTDGGRAEAGFPAIEGRAGDCVARAIAIASERPYGEVHARLSAINAGARKTRGAKTAGKPTADRGIYAKRKAVRDYMAELGFVWVPTMRIGSGCRVHLRESELPRGRIIARVSKHWAAVIDGVLYDNHDSSRYGTRCVYGYWEKRST